MIDPENFEIIQHKTYSNLYVITRTGSGNIPTGLRGSYTSAEFAQKALDAFIFVANEEEAAQEHAAAMRNITVTTKPKPKAKAKAKKKVAKVTK